MLALMVEFESDLIRSRTVEGMREAAKRGRLLGKPSKLSVLQRRRLLADYESGGVQRRAADGHQRPVPLSDVRHTEQGTARTPWQPGTPVGDERALRIQLGTRALGSAAGIGALAPGMWSCCRLSTAGYCPPAGPWA